MTNTKIWIHFINLQTWKDYRLVWKPAEYDGIGEINVPLFKGGEQNIWKPELVLNERCDGFSFLNICIIKLIGERDIFFRRLSRLLCAKSLHHRRFPIPPIFPKMGKFCPNSRTGDADARPRLVASSVIKLSILKMIWINLLNPHLYTMSRSILPSNYLSVYGCFTQGNLLIVVN